MPTIWYSFSERGSSLQFKGLVQDGPRLVPFLYFGFRQHLFWIKHSASAQRILIPYQSGPQSQFIPVFPFLKCRAMSLAFKLFSLLPYLWGLQHGAPMASLPLPVYTVGMLVSGTQPQHRKSVSGADPRFSSSFYCVYSSSGFGSQAVVSCSSLLRSTSSSSCGYSMPSWPCLCFSLFTLPMVVGHHSVSHIQTIWIPLLQSTISRSPAGLPRALSLSLSSQCFFQTAIGHTPVM